MLHTNKLLGERVDRKLFAQKKKVWSEAIVHSFRETI